MLVRVAFECRLDQAYDYLVPAELEEAVGMGMRVEAPLGRSVRVGYVVGIEPPVEPGVAYRAVKRVVEAEPVVTPQLMRLVKFVADYYYSPLGAALRCCLPAAVRKKSADAVLIHAVRPAKPLDELARQAVALSRRAPRQASILRHLADFYRTAPGASDTPVLLRLSELVARAETQVASVRALEAQGWLTIALEKGWQTESETFVPSGAPELTKHQRAAVDAVVAHAGSYRTFLLHGVTGSGKTEVYLQVIHAALQKGKGAIVLVPEIALTPQTVDRFRSRFGEHVAVLHSSLTELDRMRQWWSIRDGHARIVVGARSAVFAPVRDLGVIVVDEEHERTYKQTEEVPRYHARDVAVLRGKFESCPVILGSATPSLESVHNVKKGKYQLLELPGRVVALAMPSIRLVDLREEAKVAPQLGVISRPLRDALQACLKNGEQALLFLNRRGYCPILTCPSCGHVKRCANCAVSLTYHETNNKLRCHLCGHDEDYRPPYSCPDCRKKLNLCGFGTQRIEKNIAYLFPQARMLRMDRDTTERRGSHERILTAFSHGAVDILLGTQMIAKGLDFPNVTLVGVINADTALHVPDFRAPETAFQLITQVSGRAGRGTKPGLVIVQSFSPDHYAVACAIKGAWSEFASQELKTRRELGYPPFSHLIHVLAKGREEKAVIDAAGELTAALGDPLRLQAAAHATRAQVLGPAPAPLELAHGYHRWQVILKVSSVLKAHEMIIKPALRNRKFPGIQVIVDVDPY